MKRILKKYENYLSIKHYIAVLRRQSDHMQHVYAVIFAGSITALLAAVILYVDYGFWHDTYSRSESLEVSEVKNVETPVTVTSPGDMIGGFFKEAGDKFRTINTSSKELLNGKEEYTSGN